MYLAVIREKDPEEQGEAGLGGSASAGLRTGRMYVKDSDRVRLTESRGIRRGRGYCRSQWRQEALI